MKKLVTFLVILVMSLTAAMAQSAAKLNYQAVVRSSDNHLASNETVNVTIDIKVSGTTVFTETHTGVNTNINGLLNLVIGDPSTTHTGDFATIDWANAVIDATITWGSNTVTTSNPVNAVPYALSADVDCSDVVDCVDNAIANGSSTTNNAIDTVIENHLTPYEIKNCGDVTNCVNTAIADGSSTTNNAIDTVIENHLTPYEIKNCGDVTNCVNTAIADGSSTTNNAIDTVIENYLTPYEIKNCDDVVACPIIQNMRDSIQSNYEEIQHLTTDLNTLETRVETFNTHVCDSVADCIHDSLVNYTIKDCADVNSCVKTEIEDGGSDINHRIDTLVANNIHDSLVNYHIKDCADVNSCVKTEIEDGGSDINHRIDTLVANNIHDSLVNYTIKNCDDVVACPIIQNMRDSIQSNYEEIQHLTTDLNTLETRVETFNTHVCDSVADCIHDSLVNYTIKNCDDVVACPIIQNMRDSIQSNYEEIQHLTTDLNTLETRVETFNTHVCDSVKDCVAAQIHDSLVAHPVYNSTITFHQEGETDQSITLNQSTNQTINIVTFSQKSDRFIATADQTDFALTVPSGKTLDATNHLVQMYINGVYVGDTVDGVVKMISGTTARYQPGNNGGYTLVNDDRVNFVFWVK